MNGGSLSAEEVDALAANKHIVLSSPVDDIMLPLATKVHALTSLTSGPFPRITVQ